MEEVAHILVPHIAVVGVGMTSVVSVCTAVIGGGVVVAAAAAVDSVEFGKSFSGVVRIVGSVVDVGDVGRRALGGKRSQPTAVFVQAKSTVTGDAALVEGIVLGEATKLGTP